MSVDMGIFIASVLAVAFVIWVSKERPDYNNQSYSTVLEDFKDNQTQTRGKETKNIYCSNCGHNFSYIISYSF